jgi:hypothetical protein
VAALAFIVALGFLYLRLMFGPVTLNFLAAPIERAIADELAGSHVQIEGVALGLSEKGLIQFELRNVRVSDDGGETLVAAPAVAVSLSRRAMFGGRIAVESLDLISARLLLFHAEDGTLSLKFSPGPGGAKPGAPQRPVGESQTSPAVATPSDAAEPDDDTQFGRIDLVKVLSEASARARRLENASAYLREVGLRSATVIIDNGQRKTIWQVPQLDIDLDHRRNRSSIAVRAQIESHDGPWEITVRSYEHVRARALKLDVSVEGLVPRGLALAFPQLVALEAFDLPVSANGQLELSDTGEILDGRIAINTVGGKVALPGPQATPMPIDGGHIELTYDGASRTLQIGAAELLWKEGRVQFAGSAVHTAEGAEGPRWAFNIKATEGSIAADARAPMRLPIDDLAATGFLASEGRVVLERFAMRAGGAEVTAQGEISNIGGAPQARFEGRIGAMTADLFKTLWPSWLAPQTRTWAAQRLAGGEVLGGTFKIARGAALSRGDWAPVTGNEDRFTLALEGANLSFAMIEGWPLLTVPRALLRVEGTQVEVTVPEAAQTAPDGRKLSLKGNFSVDLGQPQPHTGELALRGQGPLSMAIDILEREAPAVLRDSGISLAGSEGTLDGNVTIRLPLGPQPQIGAATVEGRLRISDAKIPKALGGAHDFQGINVSVDLSPSAVEAKGKFLLGNVPAKLAWQHVFGAPPEKQPPLRISSILFEAERNELGLDIDDLVHGEAGIEITITQDAKGERHARLRADLANAELVLESLGWRKPVGRRAVFEFDFAKGTGPYPIEMRNVRLDGENIAIAGWMGAGQDFKVREYRFPQFSLDVVSNFEAHGKLRADNVWEVTAKGPTFDGRDLFRSFFFVPLEKQKDIAGLDLKAEFDTVLGFFETSARGVRLSMSKRANKLNQLDMRAGLAGGKQLDASVRAEAGRPRILVARSNDAGQVFKLVGFLPHAIGGDMSLEVNLDGKGLAERTGLLAANRFSLLGDAISVEGPQGPGPGGGRRRTVVRERIEFDSLRAPFSVGSGQFVLQNARIDGPLMSATMSGRVDFRTRKVHVVGTFTPLAALNKILSDVPLVGDIMTGPKREGMFAWNYALQGGLENPQVVVNPMSGVAPGFTRELFPILPVPEPAPPPRKGRGSSTGARASSTVARPAAPKGASAAAPDVSDGWVSGSPTSGASKK